MTGMHTARESPIQNFAFLERPGREEALEASEETGEEGFTGVTGKQEKGPTYQIILIYSTDEKMRTEKRENRGFFLIKGKFSPRLHPVPCGSRAVAGRTASSSAPDQKRRIGLN